MFTIISLAVLLIVGLGLIVFWRFSKKKAQAAVAERDELIAQAQAQPGQYYGRIEPLELNHFPLWPAAIPLGIFVLALIFTSFTQVNAKSEGVLVTFGKTSERTLPPGPHLKLPWQDMTEIDGKRKADYFNGSERKDDDSTKYHGDIEVKFGDGGVGSVKAQVIWSAAEGQGDRIFSEYRDDDPINNMRDNLVIPAFRDAVYDTIRTYKPTAPIDNLAIDFKDPAAVTNAMKSVDLAPDLQDLGSKAKDALNDILSANGEPLVDVEQVLISQMSLPKRAQGKIDDFLAEINSTKLALAKQATNTALAEANRILSDSISNDPNVLVSRCYDLIEEGVLKPPVGFSCWQGSGSAVVVPSAK